MSQSNPAPRFGLFLPSAQFSDMSAGQALDASVATAVAAEEAGLDDIWIAEHHFQSYGVCPSALTMAAHLLGVTSTITVGTAVTVLTHQHPVAVAEQALLLDHLSRGRFRLGVGRGGPWVDLAVFGVPPAKYQTGFGRSLDVLLSALDGSAVAGRGAGGSDLSGITIVPPPRDGARPDVVVAATTNSTIDLAAARGVPLLLGMHADDAAKAAALRRYARCGPADVDHVGVGVAHVADTDAEAEAQVRAHLPRWLRPGLASYRRVDGRPHRGRDPEAYTEHLVRSHPVGAPRRCRERIASTLRTTGLTHLAFLVDCTGDLDRTLCTVRRLAIEVLGPLKT